MTWHAGETRWEWGRERGRDGEQGTEGRTTPEANRSSSEETEWLQGKFWIYPNLEAPIKQHNLQDHRMATCTDSSTTLLVPVLKQQQKDNKIHPMRIASTQGTQTERKNSKQTKWNKVKGKKKTSQKDTVFISTNRILFVKIRDVNRKTGQ